jgi:hypothetical protein
MDYLAKARLHLAQHPARPAILVLGGSFNPIHNAHIQMFISAAEALRQNGDTSILSVICAVHQRRLLILSRNGLCGRVHCRCL